jgi:general secretion pathway protein L
LVLSTDAASAHAAETVFKQSIALHTADAVWLDALRSEWNLAQFDLARRGSAHTLRQWRRAWTTFRCAPEWRATRWCAIALIVIQLVSLNVWAWRERSVIDTKRRLQASILLQTFPEVSVVIDAPLQMERQLSQLQQGHGAPGARDFDALLLALASSPTPLPRPETLDFRDGALRLPGYTLSAEQSNALRTHLQAAGYALTADALGLTLTAPGGAR